MSVEIQLTHLEPIKKKKWTSKFLKVLLAVFILVNSVGLFVGNLLYNQMFDIQTSKGIDQFNQFKDTFNEQKYEKYEKKDISLISKHGYTLNGTYIFSPKPSEKTMILVHGLNGSRWSMMKYVELYLNKDFNVIVYDSRAHGRSEGDTVSYGYFEKDDLAYFVDYAWDKHKYGIIGVHGESLGAVTALLHAESNNKDKKVKFYIADCPFSDLDSMVLSNIKDKYGFTSSFITKPMLFYGNAVSYLRSHFMFSKVNPKKEISQVETPILFIHGGSDTFIPSSMTKDMFKLKTGEKDLYIVQKAGHAESFSVNKDAYKEKIYSFLGKIIK